MEDFGFDYSQIKAYQGYYLDDALLRGVSSGGAASVLSEAIIKMGGVVFGVRYSEDFKSAEYSCARNVDELRLFKGSKYIDTIRKIKVNGEYRSVFEVVGEELAQGQVVLFIGLGCDVAALKVHLQQKEISDEKLYCVDLICHGPTLDIVAKSFIERMEQKFHSKTTDFTVRNKKLGWETPSVYIKFQNGKEYTKAFYETDYGYAFARLGKDCCYHCKHRGDNHISDITIGDYWGMTPNMHGYNKNGVSILLVFNAKGEDLINKIDKSQFYIDIADIENALRHNPMFYKCREYRNTTTFENNIIKKGLHRAIIIDMGLLHYVASRTHIKSAIRKIIHREH